MYPTDSSADTALSPSATIVLGEKAHFREALRNLRAAEQRWLHATGRNGAAGSSRIELRAFQESREGYILQLCRGDLFLDSPAFNAHTTAVDALWAAVPLLTSPGERFVRPTPDPKTAHALRNSAFCAPPRPAAEVGLTRAGCAGKPRRGLTPVWGARRGGAGGTGPGRLCGARTGAVRAPRRRGTARAAPRARCGARGPRRAL